MLACEEFRNKSFLAKNLPGLKFSKRIFISTYSRLSLVFQFAHSQSYQLEAAASSCLQWANAAKISMYNVCEVPIFDVTHR